MKQNIFIIKKTVFFPSKTTIIFLFIFFSILFLLFCLTIHSFLAKDNPIDGEAIIAEGWLPDYCLEFVADYLKINKYKMVFVTGIPLETGSYLKEYKTYADLGGSTLKKLSISDSRMCIIPAPYSTIDRTYASAIALKKWLDSSGCSIHTFDVCSHSTHTRRSALLFQRALGKKYKVGSIAIKHRDYDPKYWWKCSQGVRSVIDETIAYVYAILFVSFFVECNSH
jgi:hypothetical protein